MTTNDLPAKLRNIPGMQIYTGQPIKHEVSEETLRIVDQALSKDQVDKPA